MSASARNEFRSVSQKGGNGLAGLFSTRLQQWRIARGLPLKQVAADLGVSISIVSAWEQGSRFPSMAHLEQIASYTGIAAWQFLCPDWDPTATAPYQSPQR